MNSETEMLREYAERDYQFGVVTDGETDAGPAGRSEDVIRFISKRKREPEWLTTWRLEAYHHWLTMEEPHWANIEYDPINYQDIIYYSAPKSSADGPKSLDDVDPELIATYEKLGIPLHEREKLAGVAVDAVFDSVSVATTFKDQLAAQGIIFCSFSEAEGLATMVRLPRRRCGTHVSQSSAESATRRKRSEKCSDRPSIAAPARYFDSKFDRSTRPTRLQGTR